VPWSYAASRLYHDGYWYPTHGKPRVEKILATDWGKLFKKYGKTGTISDETVEQQKVG
jgi:hypothetical protein